MPRHLLIMSLLVAMWLVPLLLGAYLIAVAVKGRSYQLTLAQRFYSACALLPMFTPAVVTYLLRLSAWGNHGRFSWISGIGLSVVMAAIGLTWAFQAEREDRRKQALFFLAAVIVSLAPCLQFSLYLALQSFFYLVK